MFPPLAVVNSMNIHIHTRIFLSPCFQSCRHITSSGIIYMLFSLHGMLFPPHIHFIQLNPLLDPSLYTSCRKPPWMLFLCALRASVHTSIKAILSLHCNYSVPFISFLHYMVLRAGAVSYSGSITRC